MRREELLAAADRTIPDVVGPDLTVLFCGINPGLWSAATGHHFARPGNRFWPALHRSGFTPRLLRPAEQDELPRYGLGITNVAPRATARADELTDAELRAGAAALVDRVTTIRPLWIAVLGIGVYRTGFHRPHATVGPQADPIGPAQVWVLPNPSGLNAHATLDILAERFRALREGRRVSGHGRDGGGSRGRRAGTGAREASNGQRGRRRAARDGADPGCDVNDRAHR